MGALYIYDASEQPFVTYDFGRLEVGKYTLQINKHQEYESCPRNEMKYFSGDGIIAALIDYDTFGDPSLLDASLSITELELDSVNALNWMLERMGEDDLSYQYPVYDDCCFSSSGSVEYTCSFDRLGDDAEKGGGYLLGIRAEQRRGAVAHPLPRLVGRGDVSAQRLRVGCAPGCAGV